MVWDLLGIWNDWGFEHFRVCDDLFVCFEIFAAAVGMGGGLAI